MWRRTWIATSLALCLAVPLPLMAEPSPPSLSPRQYEQLDLVAEAYWAYDPEEILARGQRLFDRPGGQSDQRLYVRAHLLSYLVPTYQDQGQPEMALDLMRQVLAEAELLERETRQAVRWLKVQFYVTAADYPNALSALESWWPDAVEIDAQIWYLRAALLADQSRWTEAEPYLLEALRHDQPDGWLALGVSLYQQQEDWAAAAQMQATRVELYPQNASQWVQLAQLQRLANDEAAALVTLELAQRRGYLSEDQQHQLGLALLQAQQPLRAAQVFDRLLETSELSVLRLRLAAHAWLLTGEVQGINQALRRLAIKGETLTDQRRLGDWLFNQGQWQAALDAWDLIQVSLTASEEADLRLLQAQAWIELEDYTQAQQIFESLLATSQADIARQWLSFLRAL